MSRKKTRKSQNWHDTNVVNMTEALMMNGRAMQEGPKRKTWTSHDLKNIKPLRPAQEDMVHDFLAGKNILAHGSAGTGKTFLAIYLALTELLHKDGQFDKIIIVRSAVPTRDMGFMPGSLTEKIALYELPYVDIFHDLFGRFSTYEDMKHSGLVEFTTTSYIRGLTWDNAIIIVDEVQNMEFHEINSIMTRVGMGTRIILAGDIPQTDLRRKGERTGMDRLLDILKKMKDFSSIKFNHDDIVRSDFVKSWIIASEEIV